MAWVKKAAAPDYLNQLATFRVAITGTADDWLLPWINLVEWGNALDVNAFCALGPPEHAAFTVDDFLGGLVGGPIGASASVLLLRGKIRQRAQEILFADLCESDELVAGVCYLWNANVVGVGHADYIPWGTGPGGLWLAIPAGCTAVRLTYAGSTTGLGDVYQGNSDFSTVTHATWHPGIGGESHGIIAGRTWLAVSAWLSSTPANLTIEYDCDVADDYTPPAITQPDSAIPPDAGTYTTIADLGAELDAIETKLHWVLNFTTNAITDQINPLVADDVIEVADPDEDVELGPNVMGFIVTLGAIPGSADERFGSPLQLHKLGRVVMGNGTAWLPPIPLSVTPMLLLRPDATITKCRVHTFPPTTATVTTLVRAEPVG